MKDIDQKIIDVMKENARISITDISKITNIPDTTIHFRLKKLKKCPKLQVNPKSQKTW